MFDPDDIPISTRHLEIPPLGMTYEVDGEAALVGVVTWHGGTCWMQLYVNDDHYRRAIFLHRRTKQMIKILFEAGEPAVFALCDDWLPKAEYWLERLGFTKSTERVAGRNVWVLFP